MLAACSSGDERSAASSSSPAPVRTAATSAESSSTPAATSAQPSSTRATTTSASRTPTPQTGTVIKTGPSQFGDVLFDGRGQAIYLFAKEATAEPACYGDCAVAWPPVLTSGSPRASGAVSADLLGTTTRTDGAIQVTYDRHPLYFYAHEGPDQVTCHNVEEFGGLWLVLGADGLAKT